MLNFNYKNLQFKQFIDDIVIIIIFLIQYRISTLD